MKGTDDHVLQLAGSHMNCYLRTLMPSESWTEDLTSASQPRFN